MKIFTILIIVFNFKTLTGIIFRRILFKSDCKSGDIMKKGKSKGIIAIVVVFALLIGTAAAIHFFNKFNNENNSETAPSVAETSAADSDNGSLNVLNPEDIEWNGDKFKAEGDEKLFNILLIGQDRRPYEGRQRSDAMILCSFNSETNELTMISFLRDLYVQIPGYSDNRLNAAYVYGGFPLITQTLAENFGVTVDGCLEVDFDSFKKIIDILGGVDIELTAAEAQIVGGGAEEGLCRLNGEQALIYTRIRKIDSDFQRTERQRKLLSSVFEKMKDCSLPELMNLVNELLPLVTTDMTDEDLLAFAASLAASLSELKIETYGVPSEGNYKNAKINGMAVLVPDLYEIKKLIFEEYLPI